MRLIRAAGQNVSPSDDGRLYDQIFSDGLFTDTAFAALGTNNVQVGAMYGDLCGRDFTIEQQTIAVPLPEGDGETTGFIYVEIDTSAETPLSVGATLAPFTPTYEDINVNGAVAQMIVAEYTASAVAVTSVTATYTKAAAGSVKAGSIATVESSPVTANHAIGEYILYGGTVYRVTAAIATGETIVPGTNVIAESVGDALTELNNGLNAFESFSGTVGGIAQTLYRKHIGNGVYIIFGSGIVAAGIGAGATSQRQIVYSNKQFTTVYGGAANFALSGQINSQTRYCAVGRDRVDAWVHNPGTETVQTLAYTFIVIGKA